LCYIWHVLRAEQAKPCPVAAQVTRKQRRVIYN